MNTRDFRNALGRFATGVAVVTTAGDGGKPEGLTVNSFAAVSLSPPLVLWCLASDSSSLTEFSASEHFNVHVLGSEQRHHSERFATPAPDKFADVDWRPGRGGAPVLDGCLALFECRRVERHDAGDHAVFIGEVEDFAYRTGEPLLFVSGRYGVPGPHPADKESETSIYYLPSLMFEGY